MCFGLLTNDLPFNNFCHWTRLDVPETGLAALVRLSNGDMRKALNILQVIRILPPPTPPPQKKILLMLLSLCVCLGCRWWGRVLYFCSLQTWIRKMIGCYKGVKYAIYCLEDGTGCSNDHCYWSVTLPN